jgi:PAS domain S-box-containing protein
MHKSEADILFPSQLLSSTVFYAVLTDTDGKYKNGNALFKDHFASHEAAGSDKMFSDLLPAQDIPLYYSAVVNCLLFPSKNIAVNLRRRQLAPNRPDEWIRWELTVSGENEERSITHIGHAVSPADAMKENAMNGGAVGEYDLDITKLKALVNHIPGAIYRCRGDEHLSLEFFSDEIEKLTGYPVEYFMKNQANGYSALVHAEDAEQLKQAIHHAVVAKEKFEIEYRIIKKGGEVRWVYESGQGVYDDEDKVDYIDGCIFDITRRKQTEAALAKSKDERRSTLKRQEELLQRLTLATDSAEIGIFEIDLGTGEVIWDDRMYEIYGYTKDTPLSLYKIFYTAVHPDDTTRMNEIISELISQKKEVNGAVYRIVLPDGRVRHIDSHAIIKKSEVTGGIVSLIGTNRDITEAVQVQEKIKMQNKVLREIAFIQSHEVRKPLANILGVIEILKVSGAITELEIFEHLVESAKELDQQIRAIVNKTNNIDDDVFR